MNARVSHLWGLKRCVNGKISTLHELGAKGNPPRKLVPVKGLGTASHKEERQPQRWKTSAIYNLCWFPWALRVSFLPISMGVTLSQMQLGYKSWVTSKQNPRKSGLKKYKTTAKRKQAEAAGRLWWKVFYQNSVKQPWENWSAQAMRAATCLVSPVETCPESHHSNLSWLLMWRGHPVKHTLGKKPMAGLPKGFKESKVGQKTQDAHTREHYHMPNPALDTGNILPSTKNLQSRCWESNCRVKT